MQRRGGSRSFKIPPQDKPQGIHSLFYTIPLSPSSIPPSSPGDSAQRGEMPPHPPGRGGNHVLLGGDGEGRRLTISIPPVWRCKMQVMLLRHRVAQENRGLPLTNPETTVDLAGASRKPNSSRGAMGERGYESKTARAKEGHVDGPPHLLPQVRRR